MRLGAQELAIIEEPSESDASNEAGQPWFNASDVCAALELGNARQAIDTHVDSDDVQKLDAIDSLIESRRNAWRHRMAIERLTGAPLTGGSVTPQLTTR